MDGTGANTHIILQLSRDLQIGSKVFGLHYKCSSGARQLTTFKGGDMHSKIYSIGDANIPAKDDEYIVDLDVRDDYCDGNESKAPRIVDNIILING